MTHAIKMTAVALTAIMMVLSSCSSSRRAVQPSAGDAPASNAPIEKRLEGMVKGYDSWKTVKVPVTLDLRKPTDASINGTITMVRDKDIHMSYRLPIIGMEVLSIYVTADSVFATFKPSKLYVAESIDNFFKNFPVTIGNAQDLLMGRLFEVGDKHLTPSDVKQMAVRPGLNGTFTVSPEAVEGVGYHFTVDDRNRVSQLTVLPSANAVEPVTAQYTDIRATKVGSLPWAIVLRARAGSSQVEASLVISYEKAEWNKDNTRTWTQPKGYKRVTAAQLLEMVKNL